MTQYVDIKMAFNGLLNSLEALDQVSSRGNPPKWLAEQICADARRLDQMDVNGFDPSCHIAKVGQLGTICKENKQLWERVQKISDFTVSDDLRNILTRSIEKVEKIYSDVWNATRLTKSAILDAAAHTMPFSTEQIQKIASEECQKDPVFISQLMRFLAERSPKVLHLFIMLFMLPPIKTLEEALQVGVRINEENDRDFFRKSLSPYLDISREILEEARKTFIKNTEKFDDEVLDIGVCVGHTLALMSQSSPQPNETTLQNARFIQAAYGASGSLPNFIQALRGTNKIRPFHSVLNELMIGTDHTVPESILKRFGLKKTERVFAGFHLKDLFLSLERLKKREGFFELATAHPSSGHSAYLSLNPPAFCDINDLNLLTMRSNFRTFKTVEELIQYISQFIDSFNAHRPEAPYEFFALDHYVKIEKEECKSES